MMIRILKRKVEAQTGAVQIVEATFVFPIMFIILFFLIYMGNAHYIKAQVESVVQCYALEGAGYCGNPMLETLYKSGRVPALSELKTQPYRNLFGGMDDIETEIGALVEKEISGNSASMFRNMYPELRTSGSNIAKFNQYVVYSTFSVEVEYDVEFPIKFMGADAPVLLTMNSRAEVPVNDTAEFIRNTDLVIDVFHGTRIGQSISDVFGKINDVINNFAKK